MDPLYNPFSKRACIECPPAVCNCKPAEECVLALRTCDQCDVVTCSPKPSSQKSSGVSGGAVAGAVVGCLIAAALLIGGLWFLRRLRRARMAQALANSRRSTVSGRPTPASIYADGVLGTPGSEKPGTPGLGPSSPRSPSHHTSGTSPTLRVYADSDINLDPFADSASIRSGSSSHVIPIAYVPPNSASMSLADGHRQSRGLSLTSSGTPLPPSRPFRSPELNLKLEPPKSATLRVSNGTDLRPPRFSSPYAASQRSAASRASTISSVGSFIYGDTPVVVSQAQGGVRQVLGVARPAVVQVPAGGLSAPSTPGSGVGAVSTPPIPEVPERSPFSPESEIASDPFDDLDKHAEKPAGSVRSLNTFGQPAVPGSATLTKSPTHTPRGATFLSEPVGYGSRPSSISTTVESAHRVVLGSQASAGTQNASARTVPLPTHRTSGVSVADSILAGFAFVPPSPSGPDAEPNQIRPGSLAMSLSESVADPTTCSAPVPTLSELARQEEEALASEFSQVVQPPSRRTLGISTYSSASGVSSSGLEAFPFHFGGAALAARDSIDINMDMPAEGDKVGPSRREVAHASLDTLALSRDLEAFPLSNDEYNKA